MFMLPVFFSLLLGEHSTFAKINMLTRILLGFLLFAISTNSLAQVYFFSGMNQCRVRNEILSNESPMYGLHIGGGINLFLKEEESKFFIKGETVFIKKGYDQELRGEKFHLRFNYWSLQGSVNYLLTPSISLQTGVDFAILFNANLKRWQETYSLYDIGLVGGVGFFENRRFNLYTRVIYGLTPMLKYHNIDSMGNFHGELKDLRNLSILMGIRFNINEK